MSRNNIKAQLRKYETINSKKQRYKNECPDEARDEMLDAQWEFEAENKQFDIERNI